MATATSHPAPATSYQYSQAPQQYQQHQPPPPQQPPSTQQRPPPSSRKSRSLSFRSDKSHGSSNNHKIEKLNLTETSAEKEAKRLHSKADPTLAMQEAEPAEVAANVKSSLAPLRNTQHKDVYGNPISEPDRSNPTRSRWERPLDTIRSFEAAIDGGYNNRRSMIRPDVDSGNNRRQSYYGGNGTGGRFSHDSYYGSRPQSMMYADRVGGSQQDLRNMNHRDTYDYQSGQNGHGAAPNGRQRWPRQQTDPQYGYNRQHANEYTIPSNHRSYETVTTASGSGTSGEPSGYQTDPTSSDNSSIERVLSAPKRQQEPLTDYGIGFSQSAPYQPPSFVIGAQSSSSSTGDLNSYQTSGALNNGGSSQPPQPPKKDLRGSILRKQMAPTLAPVATIDHVQQRPSSPEKRKSWLSRRFSKRAN